MTREQLLAFLRARRLLVQASVDATGAPQAAVVGYGVSDRLEIVFDTHGDTRKTINLRRDRRIALVVGWDDEQTLQIEGVADEPAGDELERLRRVYFAAYPDGVERLAWPGITHVCVRPTWARYSDFRPGGGVVVIDRRVLAGVELREVRADDLAHFYDHQRDPDAARMAAFEPRDRPAFDAHWERIQRNRDAVTRTIVEHGEVAGYVSSFALDGARFVAYWLERGRWGRGIATIALADFVAHHDPARPLHAWVATANVGSRRVLEKCGFVADSAPHVGDDGVEEVRLRL